MSVLIKMDMPKSCDVCDFMRTNDDLMSTDYRYMYCSFPGMGEYVTYYTQCRLEKCPLSEVPAHGRLIDADALISGCKDEKGSYYGHESAIIGEAVESAPTVIEAEENNVTT